MHLYNKLILLLIGVFILTPFTQAQTPSITDSITTAYSDTTSVNAHFQSSNSLTDSIIDFARKYLKKPYLYRPNPQIRFDCSGFSSYVYSQFGYTLKRSSAEQAEQFEKIDRKQLRTGDLVFFSGRRNNKRVGHVGIVTRAYENGKFEFIHASNQSGIVISHADEDYYARRFIKAGRVIVDSIPVSPQIAYTDTLQIPTEKKAPTDKTEINTASTPESPVYHLVRKGDTLYSIAKKYSLSVSSLKKQNRLVNDKILPGQKLLIRNLNS